MSDYFDHVEHELRSALERGAHRPWYTRLTLRTRGMGRRSRGLIVVVAALVVATPAVGAVSNWFGFGAPQQFAGHSPSEGSGTVTPGSSELTSLRVPDPQGGPPWGLRIVRTTRGETCLQIGRVESGRLGSLGIDGAWHDDRLFHPFPNNSVPPDCGPTDAAGHGFVNSVDTGEVANAHPVGNRSASCSAEAVGNHPTCPPGSVRIVFMGLLGPDAASITYKTPPNGKLKTEPTVGDDGAYLLVFTENDDSCSLYTSNQYASYGPCPSESEGGTASPDSIGAITKITYRDGHVCNLVASSKDRAPTCPPVGYVPFKEPKLTSADVATPIKVRTVKGGQWCAPTGDFRSNTFWWIRCSGAVPHGYNRIGLSGSGSSEAVMADVSFTARQPVTDSRSGYYYVVKYPPGCRAGGGSGPIGRGNISSGTEMRFQSYGLVSDCHGVYRGTVAYIQDDGTTDQPDGALAYLFGSRFEEHAPAGVRILIVGHFSYSVP